MIKINTKEQLRNDLIELLEEDPMFAKMLFNALIFNNSSNFSISIDDVSNHGFDFEKVSNHSHHSSIEISNFEDREIQNDARTQVIHKIQEEFDLMWKSLLPHQRKKKVSCNKAFNQLILNKIDFQDIRYLSINFNKVIDECIANVVADIKHHLVDKKSDDDMFTFLQKNTDMNISN